MDRIERLTITGAGIVAGDDDFLFARGDDAGDAGWGEEGGGGDRGEARGTRWPPFQLQREATAVLEITQLQRVEAGAEGDAAVHRRGAVLAVVVDHQRLVDPQLRAVVRNQTELVGPRGRDLETGETFDQELRGVAREVGAGGPVDGAALLIHVRRLAGHQRVELVHIFPDIVEAEGEAGLVAFGRGRRGGEVGGIDVGDGGADEQIVETLGIAGAEVIAPDADSIHAREFAAACRGHCGTAHIDGRTGGAHPQLDAAGRPRAECDFGDAGFHAAVVRHPGGAGGAHPPNIVARSRPGIADEELLTAADVERESAEGSVLAGLSGVSPIEGHPECAGRRKRGAEVSRGRIGPDRDAVADVGGGGPCRTETRAAVLPVETTVGIGEVFRDDPVGLGSERGSKERRADENGVWKDSEIHKRRMGD